MRQIYITKANGERVVFDENRLLTSLRRSGADDDTASSVLDKVYEILKDGISTYEIYKKAFAVLRKLNQKGPAVNYSLRRSIMAMGPDGFHFENLMVEVMKAHGYEAKRGIIIKGACVDHEVDLVATNSDTLITGELKFHNRAGLRSDLKVALYVSSRWRDVEASGYYKKNKNIKIHKKWLVTNTKFTSNAVKYTECNNTFELIGWNYPRRGNLAQMIEESGLHPVTCMTSLSSTDKRALLDSGVVSCKGLLSAGESALKSIGLNETKVKRAFKEVSGLCGVIGS